MIEKISSATANHIGPTPRSFIPPDIKYPL